MTDLQTALDLHQNWLDGSTTGKRFVGIDYDLRGAHLRGANLCGADLGEAHLREADLRGAHLRGADLRGAHLRGADLDFSVLPLCCGSFDMTVDARITRQIAYHLCRLNCDDPEFQSIRTALLPFANQFHRARECGVLTEREDV